MFYTQSLTICVLSNNNVSFVAVYIHGADTTCVRWVIVRQDKSLHSLGDRLSHRLLGLNTLEETRIGTTADALFQRSKHIRTCDKRFPTDIQTRHSTPERPSRLWGHPAIRLTSPPHFITQNMNRLQSRCRRCAVRSRCRHSTLLGNLECKQNLQRGALYEARSVQLCWHSHITATKSYTTFERMTDDNKKRDFV